MNSVFAIDTGKLGVIAAALHLNTRICSYMLVYAER